MENNNGSVFYNKEGSNLQDIQSFSEGGSITITSSDGEIDLGGLNLRAVAIQCITDVVFTQLVEELDNADISGTESGDSAITYPAGFTLYGSFTLINLSSGIVRGTLASTRIG